MKSIYVIIALAISSLFYGQNKTTITVTVNNVSSDTGKVYFGLHTEDTFMKAKAIQSQSSTIKDGKVTIVFKDVAPGTYAVICFHDLNENEKMDFETNGMPKEAYGTSNNIMSYGPPQWDDSKFTTTTQDISLEIRL